MNVAFRKSKNKLSGRMQEKHSRVVWQIKISKRQKVSPVNEIFSTSRNQKFERKRKLERIFRKLFSTSLYYPRYIQTFFPSIVITKHLSFRSLCKIGWERVDFSFPFNFDKWFIIVLKMDSSNSLHSISPEISSQRKQRRMFSKCTNENNFFRSL